ncbi:DNA repair protein RecN [Nodosilinea sp. LEGE 07088]|uniref:DNA repair protein RecN n=1 Tax=Nodosilinea sp. LEGE 07088 TaxID=2777968 RepID=UPI00187E79AA|nr:DNA repair protein RecN [Nodosilinea sp. LEGE 07088]MBE9137187.1 DNA repair protein RecN [Nodosilinea sp. LEGE 07088]
MLTALHIENFALIDHLDLRLEAGLNVLTGETGAGKSIILDAIDAVLGGKANQRLVRSGSQKALVEAAFEVPDEIHTWLAEQELPLADGPLMLRRELTLGKTLRSRSFLNDKPATRPQLEGLRQKLVEITAQGQTVLLGSGDRQREWLDGFGGAPLGTQRQQVALAYQAATQAQKRLTARRKADQQRCDQLELLQMHQQDLEQAQLDDPQELDLLTQEHHRLNHSVDLQQNSYRAYQILYESEAGDDACADLLGKAEGILVDMERYDPALSSILSMVSEALTQVEEAGRAINAYGASVEADPQRLDEVEERMRQLKGLCRRFRRTLPELVAYRDEVMQSLAELSGEGQSVEALEAEVDKTQEILGEACATLTQLRRNVAQELETRLVSELKPLAMDRVQFEVELRPITPTAAGADSIRFLFSPNPGEPLQPLAETASGGEMSRFLLALKACFSQVDPVGTLVFDEIDVGVSGRVAQAIAEKLYHLGRQHQVLCVTHQPMVAALADAHFRVGKQVVEAALAKGGKTAENATERTVVRVLPLSLTERREELAQLAGGESHQQSLSFAEALLSQADGIRQKQ